MSTPLDQAIARADGFLARFRNGVVPHLIDGKPDAGGGTFETASPVDNAVIAKVARGGAAEIDRAAKAAMKAFRTTWSHVPGEKRREILHKIADAIEARADEIAHVECMDTGQPIRYMSKAALRGAENFRFYADRAPNASDGLSLPTGTHLNYTLRQPIGPVGVITPWNTPFMLSTWKIAPALAAGCTVVHKPAEWSPLTATLLAEICLEAGLPAGVLNVVHGIGEEAGKALTEHPDIRAIGFVGESATGSAIMSQGAKTLKRVHFELGGKNPVIVFADADLDRALDACLFMIYSLNGERCTSSSRALVEASIYEDFAKRAAERVKKIKVGHPLDPATEIGPLIHPRHVEKVLSYVSAAQKEGAKVAVGGGRANGGKGNFVEPTLYTHANQGMKIAQEEIFGPVLTMIPFADEKEALAIANDVRYGLTAYIWTRDVGRAHRIAQNVEAGMVWVNSENVRHLPTPFGGMKASGIGRDGGDYSFDFYMETKNIAIALDNHKIPKIGGLTRMPIVKPNFAPPFNVIRASHVEFGVRDPAKSRAFYIDCLGYLLTEESADALYLRAVEERNHHSIVLRKTGEPSVHAIGFKVASEEDLDRAAFWFARKGLPTSFPELPYQGRTLRTQDPTGMPLDLYFRMDQAESKLRRYGEHKGARIQRIDHINCFTPDVQLSYEFYTDIGFRLTEYTETDGDDAKLWAVWMHRKGNVHDLAFTNGRGPRLHHIGVWTASALDILHICDVMASSGFLANMERGPGRHGISNAFFLYTRDPDNHRVELFTSDYLTVDPDFEPLRWSLKDPQRQTLWGHPAPKSWFEEGSQFTGVKVIEPVLEAQPIVAR